MFDDLKEKLFKSNLKGEEVKEGSKVPKTAEKSKNGIKGISSNFMTNLVIVFLVGVLLVIVGSMFSSPKGTSNKGSGALAVANDNEIVLEESEELYSAVDKEYKLAMEEELVGILEEIEGVGKVKAVINFENGAERVPVFNEDISKSETSETDTNGGERNINQENGGNTVVMESINGDQKPFISKTNNPTISGVLIVAEGAGERVTELRIHQAAAKLFGLEDDKVKVYPMKK